MAIKNQDPAVFRSLIELLYTRTDSYRLIHALSKLCEIKSESLTDFSRAFRENEILISRLAGKLLATNTCLQIRPWLVEQLLWFILFVPLAQIEDYEDQLIRTKLSPILPAFRHMFSRLVAEYNRKEKTALTDSCRYVQTLLSIVVWLDAELEEHCKKMGMERVEQAGGVYNFYIEQQVSLSFEHFALLCPAYFNWSIIYSIDKEIQKQGAIRKKGDIGKERAESRLNEYLKSSKSMPPHNKELNNPIALMRNILFVFADLNMEREAINREKVREAVEEYCYREDYMPSTIARKHHEMNELFDIAATHWTIWGEYQRIKKKISNSFDDLVSIEEGGGEIERGILAQSDTFDDYLIGEHDGGLVSIKDFNDKYVERSIQTKYYKHHMQGGILRLIYCWSNRRVVMYDKLCFFLGYLVDRDEKLAEVCLESVVTGASVKNIVFGRESTNKTVGLPVGLFLTIEELAGVKDIDRESFIKGFEKAIRDFNKTYPDWHLNSADLVYTGRAWHLDKICALTLAEASHVAGSYLPGTFSDLFYILPDQLLASFKRSSLQLIERLLEYGQWNRKNPSGFSKEINERIERSSRLLREYRTLFRERMEIRKKVWEKNRPAISITNKQIIRDIWNRIFALFPDKHPFDMEYVVKWEVVMAFVFFLVLALRKSEFGRVREKDISLLRNYLVLRGEGNRAYIEVRVLPLPMIVVLLLEKYEAIRRKARQMKLVPEGGDGGRFWLFPEDAIQRLNEIVREVSGNVEENASSIRKYAITSMHNGVIKKAPGRYFEFQGMIGHTREGFEMLSSTGYSNLGVLEPIIEEYAKQWEDEMHEFIKDK